jgi:hypothetical protein
MTNSKLAAGAAGLALIAAGGVAAVGASGAADTAQAPETAVVKQKYSLKMVPNRYVQDGMRFDKDVYRVQSGGTLRLVLNKPQEGPHTVTLVKRKDLPRTAQEAFNNCKVCNAMNKAHGVPRNGEGPPQFQFVENGEGQNQPADFDRPGDSGVTAPRKGSSFEANVTAPPGSTRHILCILHPWMQAKLKTE